jgi:hypothetical protein
MERALAIEFLAAKIDRDVERLKQGTFSFSLFSIHLDMLCKLARSDSGQVFSDGMRERILDWERISSFWLLESNCIIPHHLRKEQRYKVRKRLRTLSGLIQ